MIKRREENPGASERKNFFDDDGPIDLGDVDDNEDKKGSILCKKPKIIFKGGDPFEPTRKKKKL